MGKHLSEFCSENPDYSKKYWTFGRKNAIIIMRKYEPKGAFIMNPKICLLDLNYTLVGNQQETMNLRPFSRRVQAETYRSDLIEAVRADHVVIITARPVSHQIATLQSIFQKTGWEPEDAYFNDMNAYPSVFKESALKRFIFPKYGTEAGLYYAVESNPRTRAMYARYGIVAQPYEEFIQAAKAV